MDLHLAGWWEAVADTVPDRPAVVHGDRRLTWRQYEDQASRLAAAFADDLGVGDGTAVALYLRNQPEYLVAQFAAFKLRALAVNVNHRYADDELTHVLRHTGSEVVVCDAALAERVARVQARGIGVRHVVVVGDADAAVAGHRFDDLVAGAEPMPRQPRAADDRYLLCTGGTTGLPKAVLYRHGERAARFAAAGLRPLGIDVPTRIEQVPAAVRRVGELGRHPVTVVCCPLMHGTGMWLGAFSAGALGGTTVTLTGASLDPDEVWATVERERATDLVIVGDPVAKPLLAALDRAPGRRDLSSLRAVASSGATWSAPVKEALLAHADVLLVDRLGSTEGALVGVEVSRRGAAGATARFEPTPGTRLFTEDLREPAPGSGEPGVLATPATAIGYLDDEEGTAKVFREVDGVRYVWSGDWATRAADGSIELLGRGSGTINTGGEKVHAEEVEEAAKCHPGVADCLVVGIPDPTYGEAVVAVVAAIDGVALDGAEVVAAVRARLAGYKVPRRVVVVPEVRRSPSAKPDYGWARQVALEASDRSASAI